MSRKIPGLNATIVDYQIKADTVTDPGELVVILCDLPDQISITDDNGEIVSVVVPANVPLLVNAATDLANLITGTQLVNGLDSLTGKDRNLDIVNVLPMLSSTLPLAVCKIVRRNGERPDTTDMKQMYEALELAYESLENYPAGRIVPLGVSIEDSVVTANKINYENFKGFTIANADVAKIIDPIVTFEKEEYQDTYKNLNLALSFVNDTTLKAKIALTDSGSGVSLINTTFDLGLDIIFDPSAALTAQYKTLLNLVKPNGSFITTPVNVPLDSYLPLIQASTYLANIASAKAENSFGIVDPAEFEVAGVATPIAKAYTQDLFVSGIKIGTFKIDFNFAVPNGVVYDTGSYTVDWANLVGSDKVIKSFDSVVDPGTWYNGTTFLLLNEAGVTIVNPVDKNLTATASQKISVDPALFSIISNSSLEILALDRSSFTVEKHVISSDVRTTDVVGIDFDANINTFSVSSLIVISEAKVESGAAKLVVNEEEIVIEADKVLFEEDKAIVLENFELNFKDSIKIKFLKGLQLPVAGSDFEIEITVVPANATFDARLVQACFELTTQMNDCVGYMGVKPPKTTSSEDIKAQVTRVINKIGTKSYAKGTLDHGAHLVVTTGAQKVDGYGGVTDFSETKITGFNKLTNTVSVDESLTFAIGDKVDLIAIRKGKYLVNENVVSEIVKTTTGYDLVLKLTLDETFTNSSLVSTRKIQISNAKDRTGSFLAALYAVEANNYGIDKAPFNYTLPGSNEIMYSSTQLKNLSTARITPVTRKAFNTNGYVFDTPTMAGTSSDFQDQGTFGLVLYFIRQLRKIAEARKGQRFGAADKQVVFQTELETPFKAQNGITITGYKLTVDFDTLNSSGELKVSFQIKEAKKLKVISITARLY